MDINSELDSILSSNPKVIEHSIISENEVPRVRFRLNTGNGSHTVKEGDVFEYDRFYEFNGLIRSTKDLNDRLSLRWSNQ